MFKAYLLKWTSMTPLSRMAKERYPELVHERVGYAGTVILLLREIESSLKEKRTIAWVTADSADVMLQSLEGEMIRMLGILS
jgi:hypothetical protein